MIKIRSLGIIEDFSVSDKQVLDYINNQDFNTRLEFAIGIDIESHSISDQLIMLAAYTNKLMLENLNPAQKNALRGFLQAKLDKI